MTAGVTIVIPVWNRADLLRKLLGTIALQTCPPHGVIVVDNGSVDDAAAVAGAWGARVISMGENRGFAAAVNCGIKHVETDWVALVNTDVELRPDWLEQLLQAARETGAWFATGKMLRYANPSELDGTWDLIAKSGCAWRAGHGRPDSAVFSTRRPIAMTSATAVLYSRELFDRIGDFGEQYESYLEDVDLSLRCAAEGFTGVYEPRAVCLHHGSASGSGEVWSARMTYLLARNQELLIRSRFAPELRREWRWKIAAGRLLWGLVALRHGQFSGWIRGKRDARRTICPVPAESDRLRNTIIAAEREIAGLQRVTGPDLFWRLYFLITGGASE